MRSPVNAAVLMVALACSALACSSPRFAGKGAAPPSPGTEQAPLADAKRAIMDADYRADLAALTRWRGEVRRLAVPAESRHLALYWSGFASWRLAINGSSRGMTPADLVTALDQALADFEASFAARADFADAYAAAASIAGWQASFQRDAEAQRAIIKRSAEWIARARQLEPDNPRVLWVEAQPFLFLPPDRGGDRARAIALYRRMIEVASPLEPASPRPDWGLPEAHMSLAFAQLGATPPDVEAAEREALSALALRPDWSYVKDQLLPQIGQARAARP